MEGLSSNGGGPITATVVRQFAASRIERQLLAQAFDLLCGRQWEVKGFCCSEQSAPETHHVGVDQEAMETGIVGRPLA